MELSRRDFLYSHLLSYLRFQTTTGPVNLPSAFMLVSNAQKHLNRILLKLGINT